HSDDISAASRILVRWRRLRVQARRLAFYPVGVKGVGRKLDRLDVLAARHLDISEEYCRFVGFQFEGSAAFGLNPYLLAVAEEAQAGNAGIYFFLNPVAIDRFDVVSNFDLYCYKIAFGVLRFDSENFYTRSNAVSRSEIDDGRKLLSIFSVFFFICTYTN